MPHYTYTYYSKGGKSNTFGGEVDADSVEAAEAKIRSGLNPNDGMLKMYEHTPEGTKLVLNQYDG
ncbi:hypothetical protein [Pseudomonas agarici]|uniref:hypothetical protein n=1 Tax=Pseudomonas agarici TaxID=46677 RepID=UPI00036A4696|nr:hypothetical protein [Pseudomonas agarici]NWB92590.1 hypothetical protein [Pseudomonas agarici]NWC07583.1 hypothetical protein [Pseudomonas agarici]SEL06709.1 hypothetical protein SAMN05216604_11094 [Pseudomonas agarici]